MKRLYTLIITILSVGSIAAYNLPTIDYKPVHFGFCLGVNVLDYGFKPSMIEQNGTIYQADVVALSPGFSVGVFGDVRLHEYFNLRLVPTLHLGDRTVTFVNDQNDEQFKTTIKSTMMTVPLYVKYNAVRIRNYRPYLIAGGGGLFEFSHDKSKPILQRYVDYYIEFGAGCTIYTEYFRLAPEIKFALGFRNLITPWEERIADPATYVDPEFEKYNRAITRLTSRIFTFVLNFE